MFYHPLNYEQINNLAGHYNPSQVKAYNNASFWFWERSLFQRACSTIEINDLPESWRGSVRDFLYYCLFRLGFVSVFENVNFGVSFQPCTLSGYDFYYQPSRALITNPALETSLDLKIHQDCELIKLTPDYRGAWDIISYYAEKLSCLDNAINMSIINNKYAFVLASKTKAGAEALKKVIDKVNKGEPAVILDKPISSEITDKSGELFWSWDQGNLKERYLTTEQLKDFQTLINNFDAEVGIPTIPYEKKERMVTGEAESRVIDSSCRSLVWFRCLEESIKQVNDMFGLNITVKRVFTEKEVAENGRSEADTNRLIQI